MTNATTHAERVSEKRRFAANTVLNGVTQSASMVASLVFMPMLVSSFGLTHYGLFMLASSVTAYASLADFGVGSALTKMVAEHHARNDRSGMAGVVAGALQFYVVAGALVAAVMVGLAFVSGWVFDIGSGDAQVMRNMLLLGAVFQLVYWPTSTARHILVGLQRFDVIAKTSVLATVLAIGATLVVLITGEGPLLLVGLSGVSMSLVALVTVIAAWRLSGLRRIPLARGAVHLGAILSFSWPVFVVQLSDTLFYGQTDRLVLGVMIGAAAVGLYEAAAKFSVLVTYLSSFTVAAVLPLASGMAAEERHASLRSLFVRGSKYVAALVAPIAVTLAVLAEPIIEAWLGPDFAGQGMVAALLVLPHALVSLGVMGDAIVISRGRIGKRIPYILAQAALNLVLSIVLAARYGVLGVAIGTAVAHLVDFPLHVRFLLAETGLTSREWLRSVILPVYPPLLVPLAIGLALRDGVLASTLPGLAILAALMVSACWLVTYFTGLGADERVDLWQIARSLVRPKAV